MKFYRNSKIRESLLKRKKESWKFLTAKSWSKLTGSHSGRFYEGYLPIEKSFETVKSEINSQKGNFKVIYDAELGYPTYIDFQAKVPSNDVNYTIKINKWKKN